MSVATRAARACGRRVCWFALTAAIVGYAGQAAAQQSATVWSLQLESGAEYDSNVHRLEERAGEDIAIEASPVARTLARLRLSHQPTSRERLRLFGYGGIKLFANEDSQSENVAVTSGDVQYERLLPGRSAQLGAALRYYDAFSLEQQLGPFQGRTFRTLNADTAMTLLGEGGHRVTGLVGYRLFTYKPDPLFDWQGDSYGLSYQTTVWRGDPDQDASAASFDVLTAYRVERRGYDSTARTSSCANDDSPDPLCSAGTRIERADLHHSVAAEVIYTGERVYSARYEVQVNDSNSFGESWVRQRLELGATAGLPGGLFLTAEIAVLLNIYRDPLLLSRDEQAQSFVSIEDENRNAASLHLARPLGPSWAIEARYALYSNEFTNQELSFRRQIFYVGAVYRFRP